MPRVQFTSHLERFFPGLSGTTTCEGATVRDLVAALDAKHPGLRDYLLAEDGSLRPHVNVFVGNELVRDRRTLGDRLQPDSDVYILQALSGG